MVIGREHRPTNHLELRAVFLVLQVFHPLVQHKAVRAFSDNVTMVVYINHQGGILS